MKLPQFKKGDKVRYIGDLEDYKILWSEEDFKKLQTVLTVDLAVDTSVPRSKYVVRDTRDIGTQGIIVKEFPDYYHLNNENLELVKKGKIKCKKKKAHKSSKVKVKKR